MAEDIWTDNLVTILGKIKDLRRRGWIKRDVCSPESDADHMYSVAVEVLLMAPPDLDRCHCLELALTHDLPEVYSSDFTPGEIPAEEKHALEQAAAQRLAVELNFPKLAEWFNEYEEQSSPEARFVRCLDKMDNIVTPHIMSGKGAPIGRLCLSFPPGRWTTSPKSAATAGMPASKLSDK